MPHYLVRRVNLGKTAHLDALAHAAGEVYTRTLVCFWRTVRKKRLWLNPKSLMRLIPNDPAHRLHAHRVDAAVQSFFAGLASWRQRRKTDANARPPRKRKWYFRVEYKRSALSLKADSYTHLTKGKRRWHQVRPGKPELWRSHVKALLDRIASSANSRFRFVKCV